MITVNTFECTTPVHSSQSPALPSDIRLQCVNRKRSQSTLGCTAPVHSLLHSLVTLGYNELTENDYCQHFCALLLFIVHGLPHCLVMLGYNVSTENNHCQHLSVLLLFTVHGLLHCLVILDYNQLTENDHCQHLSALLLFIVHGLLHCLHDSTGMKRVNKNVGSIQVIFNNYRDISKTNSVQARFWATVQQHSLHTQVRCNIVLLMWFVLR